MKSRRVSILGCGWLGLPLAITLKKEGYSVKGSTTRNSKLETLEKNGISSFLISLDDQQIIGDVPSFLDSEILIVNIPPKRIPNILEYYANQMELLITSLKGSAVQHVLFISSSAVYQNLNGVVDESTRPLPEKESGKAVLKAEQLFQSNTTFSNTILRFAGLIGPDRNPGRFLAGKTGLAGGDNPVNLIHLEDCIGIIKAILKQHCWNEIFNGCYPAHPSRKEYYQNMAARSGLPAPSFDPKLTSSFKLINGEKVAHILNYRYQAKI